MLVQFVFQFVLKEILEGEMLVLFVSVRVEGDTGRRDGDAEGLAHVSTALLDRADRR